MSADVDVPAREGASARWPVLANLAAFAAALWRSPRGRTAGFAWGRGRLLSGALATIAVLAFVATLTDAAAINAARMIPPPVDAFFDFITDYGKSGWFLIPLGVALLALAITVTPRIGGMAQRLSLSIAIRLTFLTAAIGLPGLVVTIGKRLIGRARPFATGEADPYVFAPFGWNHEFASFPSGHATTSFAAAVAIGAIWPRARPVIWLFAITVGVSRVAVLAHHPSDVVAGALAGVLGAILVRGWFADRRLGFVIEADGSVRAKPGPSGARLRRLAARLLGH